MSKLNQKNKLQYHVEQFLADVFFHQKKPTASLLLAYSGGLDSTVLLHLLANLRQALHFNLTAAHIHHGLSRNADSWAEFCLATCTTLNLSLQTTRVKIPADNDLGIEAAARRLRYDALFESTADYICLAQHQDDQAETLLLQLARGAGVKGLSAMAAIDYQRRLLRPLLNVSRADLLSYAQQNNLTWIEDESNQNTKFNRNFIRHNILPVLNTRYPAITKTLARSATHLAEAATLLDELAALDALKGLENEALNIGLLQASTASRARNLLRWWIAKNTQVMGKRLEFDTLMPNNLIPSTELLTQIFTQLTQAKVDAKIEIVLAKTSDSIISIRRYQGFAYMTNIPKVKPQHYNIIWQGEPSLTLPDNSQLIFTQQLGCGLALKHLAIQKLRISYRQGGERFKPDANRPTRTLKHLLQKINMPPWQREWCPLIYLNEKLVLVPSLGVSTGMEARNDEIGYSLVWQQSNLFDSYI